MADQKIKVIIPAGGIGFRFGSDQPKQFLPFRGKTLIETTLALFSDYEVWVPVPEAFESDFRRLLGDRVNLVLGGSTRFDSVRNAFEVMNADDDCWIVIHDAARPFFDPATLLPAVEAAQATGAAIYAAPATDTIKWATDGLVEKTLDRSHIYHAQTPQIFRASLLRDAYAVCQQSPTPTDESAMIEAFGIRVAIFPCSHSNRKITQPEDMSLLHAPIRIGHGYDVHRFEASRPLFLGGIEIPGGPGLLGHSDADVAIHALIDALLGAAGKGDIGHWFPDNDDQFKDIRSTQLLEKVWADLSSQGFRLMNADITIQAQIPKLAPYIEQMRLCLSAILAIDSQAINIKATTTEGLGFVGEKQGMASHAVALLSQEGRG